MHILNQVFLQVCKICERASPCMSVNFVNGIENE